MSTTTKAAHTPGPWEYGVAHNYNGFYVAPKSTLPTLAAVERCGHSLSVQCLNFPGDTEANARLIAAAPEMLEALEGLILLVSSLQAVSGVKAASFLMERDAYKKAEAAIQKARQ
jgi:hypothetical protein